MSQVLNVLVLPDYTPQATEDAMREGFVDSGGRKQYFRDIAEYKGSDGASPADFWGGGKLPEVEVWAGAFNHCTMDEVRAWLGTLDWGGFVAVASKPEGVYRWNWEVLHEMSDD